jgi:hypothetical protein
VHQPDGENGSGAIGNGTIPTDRAQDDDPTNEEDVDELEERQLAAWAPAEQSHNEKQKKVSKDRMKDSWHIRSSRYDAHLGMHLLSTYHADGEVENARASRLERKIYTGAFRSGEGVSQTAVSDGRILGCGYNALGSQRFDQAITDVQLDFPVVDRRLAKYQSPFRRRLCTLSTPSFSSKPLGLVLGDSVSRLMGVGLLSHIVLEKADWLKTFVDAQLRRLVVFDSQAAVSCMHLPNL